jgi:rhodanese-related sulfurtransferase
MVAAPWPSPYHAARCSGQAPGHLPGSVNIPDDHLEDMLRHGNPFPGSRTIVFVCPVGEYSRRLAAFFRLAGHDAASLAGGGVAWRDAGLPLESGLTRLASSDRN